MEGIRKANVANKDRIKENEDEIVRLEALEDTIPARKAELKGILTDEIAAVKLQKVNDASNATLPLLKSLSLRGFLGPIPKKINKLVQKFNGAKNSAAKFPIILELREQIHKWKQEHTQDDGSLKVNLKTNENENHLKIINQQEDQLEHTQSAITTELFGSDIGAQVPPVEGGGKGVSLVKEAMGGLATAARGSRLTGGAGSSQGVADMFVKSKDGDDKPKDGDSTPEIREEKLRINRKS